MSKSKKNGSVAKTIGLITLGLIGLGALIATLLNGTNIALLSPKGAIAEQQLGIGLIVTVVLLLVAVPTLCLLYFTAWKYRESNPNVVHDPKANYGKRLNTIMWVLPIAFLLALAPIMWATTHKLEPKKTIEGDAKPLKIQVVAMRWKWVFIYPELNVATVNFVQIPINTPIQFDLTSDEAPMSSFWIPNLGGQLYTMTGHNNRLNLIADKAGDYPGSSAEINGAGFAGMKFTARATEVTDFDQWVQQIRQTSSALDSTEYSNLLKPSENNPSAFYTLADSGLYDTVLMKYMGASGHNHQPEPHHDGGHH